MVCVSIQQLPSSWIWVELYNTVLMPVCADGIGHTQQSLGVWGLSVILDSTGPQVSRAYQSGSSGFFSCCFLVTSCAFTHRDKPVLRASSSSRSIFRRLVQPLLLGDLLCVKVLFNEIPFKAHTDASVLRCYFHCKHRSLAGHLPWECRTVASEGK